MHLKLLETIVSERNTKTRLQWKSAFICRYRNFGRSHRESVRWWSCRLWMRSRWSIARRSKPKWSDPPYRSPVECSPRFAAGGSRAARLWNRLVEPDYPPQFESQCCLRLVESNRLNSLRFYNSAGLHCAGGRTSQPISVVLRLRPSQSCWEHELCSLIRCRWGCQMHLYRWSP